ncbi:CGI-121-domain-containing protein [Metschnikowia bicuspidata var. bicuspidata NRRL YB-4993]|uniref:EKC/KEOPS complex subunit CGI121 n=1 Tax=Metschnikowia bicuspidata var. bicuspidata NRRL YB-4993 TaxID=869754 RepID=A0A1A0H290_9ASCO|nr:CGI-121-domain-containing protein [Metschnikowia bicuspidata var. bicuspidata NRRL YB-4993]OBA18042.1 CGI-121-domain-containing protein [Metschnikowia bicuspidata var. bicuspidata NRRL YB-4993]
MAFSAVSFPLFPSHPVFVAYYDNVPGETLATVKKELMARNPAFDYCFLSTTHLISVEQLRCALHRAVQNLVQDTMKANTVNTEIIFSLSPVNNINDALKRFGVDETRADVIVVKVCRSDSSMAEVEKAISALLGSTAVALSDEALLCRHDAKKFRKLFKLLDATDASQQGQTRGAVAASLLRGL